MQFLTEKECRAWASARRFPLGESPYSVLADGPPFSVRYFSIPRDAGVRVAIVRDLWNRIGSGRHQTLLWPTQWSVWPSSEHVPLALGVRRGLGEERPLIEAPGCVARLGDDDNALSILVVAILFLWDCWMLSGDGATATFLSHDEWGAVCSLGIDTSAAHIPTPMRTVAGGMRCHPPLS
jgi:hypothetical protein